MLRIQLQCCGTVPFCLGSSSCSGSQIFYPRFRLRFQFLPSSFKLFFFIKTPAGYLNFCFFSRQLHACVGQCPVRGDLVWYFLCNRNRSRNLDQGYGSGSGSSTVKMIRFRRFRFRLRFRNTVQLLIFFSGSGSYFTFTFEFESILFFWTRGGGNFTLSLSREVPVLIEKSRF